MKNENKIISFRRFAEIEIKFENRVVFSWFEFGETDLETGEFTRISQIGLNFDGGREFDSNLQTVQKALDAAFRLPVIEISI
jgi:hypothetical protein